MPVDFLPLIALAVQKLRIANDLSNFKKKTLKVPSNKLGMGTENDI